MLGVNECKASAAMLAWLHSGLQKNKSLGLDRESRPAQSSRDRISDEKLGFEHHVGAKRRERQV